MADLEEEKPHLDLEKIRQRLAERTPGEPWRSLDELAESEGFEEFLKEEFPRQASIAQALSRRDFLKLLAAPLALAGLSACIPQPSERILPYADQPEAIVPGKPLFFATAMEMDGYARGLLVESHEGRPTKVEGNPNHPASLGAADVFAQASILNLYDPDRAQVVSNQGNLRTWEAFQADITQILAELSGTGGSGFRLLTGAVTSPTLAAQIRELLAQYPQARWHQYEPVGRDNVNAGATLAFGEPVETRYHFDRANVILSLDNNFVLHEPGSLQYLRQFSSRRQVDGAAPMNRLYVVESTHTTAGGFADHRLPLKASQIETFARALARRLGVGLEAVTGGDQFPEEWLSALVDDLQANSGSSLIIAGLQQPPAVHALAHAMNQALGNVGETVIYSDPVVAEPFDGSASIAELAQELEAGEVELLVVLEGNPVYSTPADINFGEQYRKARRSVYLGLYDDETAELSTWHIPAAHYLEMWGDTRALDGTVSLIQPLIEPLYGGRSPYELLALLLGQTGTSGYDIVRGFWQAGSLGEGTAPSPPAPDATVGAPASGTPGAPASLDPAATPAAGAPTGAPTGEAPGQGDSGAPTQTGLTSADFERFWQDALRQGIIPNTSLPPRPVTLRADIGAVLGPPAQTQGGDGGLELVFDPDPSIWDGRFANNAWLQELPRPITKLTWDNAALVSPVTAGRLGLSNEDVVELTYLGRSLRAPVWILPGQPDDSVTLHLGYGRARGGRVLAGHGVNANILRTTDAPWFGPGLELSSTGRRYKLASTQDHQTVEGRPIIRSTDLEAFQADPLSLHSEQEAEAGSPPSLYPEWEYEGHAWGMSINLNACLGCNACVIACQAENNVPVVGKDQVENGREMHWLRLDTYFNGGLDNPEVFFQPMLCQHCEKAPCEPVCPVEATSHSSEGLNEMTYNRCVGTRYCSNNCPYKVRRFNFLQYVEEDVIPLQMLHNPDVTVRSRGVMEKCTYCVQRINAARVQAKIEGRRIEDGEVVTACQQACPTQAIVFGDINLEGSQVRRLKGQTHDYAVLGEIGTQPRTTYLAKIRNPNPNLGRRS